MATWFEITYTGEPTEADYARVAELAAQGFTSGQLSGDEDAPEAGTEPEFWSTGERLAHESHHFADIARHPRCRICVSEWHARRNES